MVIWEGFGYVVAILTFLCLFATEFISEQLTKDDQFYQTNPYIISVGFLAAAPVVYVANQLLARRRRRVLIDAETGEKHVLDGSGTLMFIPNRWWPAVLVGLAMIAPFIPRD